MLFFTALLLCPVYTCARGLHALEDLHAFPRYRVSFLSHLPLKNATAQKWISQGLSGGELEFLDQPFPSLKEIASGEPEQHTQEPISHNYSLEHMRMGPKDSYLCFIPKPLDQPAQTTPEPEIEVSPAHSWSLLQPLAGTCLYHRQGWFTYSYCHNSEIRQFKERIHPHGTAPGGYKPEEDPKWEAYTLGRAPQSSTDVAVREGSIELAHGGGGGSRYLVQTWGDGTMCDKSGKPREVQVQFHCSMAMSDTILFVKEAKTCSYVLVINTPRLCGEPGFKSTRDVSEQAYIQCREVVDDPQVADEIIEGKDEDFPRKLIRTKAELGPLLKDDKSGTQAQSQQYNEIIKKAMDMLLGSGQGTDGVNLANGKLVVSDDGAVMVEFVEDLPLEDLIEDDEHGDNGALMDRLKDILLSGGFELKGDKVDEDEEGEQMDDLERPLDEL